MVHGCVQEINQKWHKAHMVKKVVPVELKHNNKVHKRWKQGQVTRKNMEKLSEHAETGLGKSNPRSNGVCQGM